MYVPVNAMGVSVSRSLGTTDSQRGGGGGGGEAGGGTGRQRWGVVVRGRGGGAQRWLAAAALNSDAGVDGWVVVYQARLQREGLVLKVPSNGLRACA